MSPPSTACLASPAFSPRKVLRTTSSSVPVPSPALTETRDKVSRLVASWDDRLADSIAAEVVGNPQNGDVHLALLEDLALAPLLALRKVLHQLRNEGFTVAIDDFGTGYSSMSLMKQFPIDTIKIDRSFIRDLPVDSEDQAIAQAIISMGKALGMTVIAEGVETLEQEAFLRSHACDEVQGFLFSKPLPARQLADLLRGEPPLASPPLQPEAGSGLKGAVV